MYSQDTNFIVPPSAYRQPKQLKKKWYQRWWAKLVLILVVLFLVLAVALAFYFFKVVSLLQSGQLTPQQLFNNQSLSPAGNLATWATSDDPSFGPKDAKVVVVEFSDFQCPFCQQVWPVVKEILKNYGDKILFIYRDFPLTDIHPQALIAALAGECADEQGKFWAMHDKIFADQDNISEANLKTYAVQIGLNSLQFNQCLQSEKYLAEVKEDLEAGLAAGVQGTPTFFINGAPVRGAVPLSVLESLILAALSR
jgi:protein-disulfide isomerase